MNTPELLDCNCLNLTDFIVFNFLCPDHATQLMFFYFSSYIHLINHSTVGVMRNRPFAASDHVVG